MRLRNKNIILGVTGGIAAYKSLELTRLLVKEGANVTPILTKSAVKFITPLSISVLSGNEALTEMFDLTQEVKISHIDLADSADLVLIAPATANTIGQIAGGLSPDLLTTVVMATKGPSKVPIMVCPAMNDNMYDNEIVMENIEKLKSHGYHFVDPEAGMLACGHVGMGRLASIETITESVVEVLAKGDLLGEHILITAGPTREAIDPVRYITNGSSGKMGYELARESIDRGARVTLISGPVDIEAPRGVEFIKIKSSSEMHKAVMDNYIDSTIIVMTAAVSDYRPENISESKIKKSSSTMDMTLVKTTDILKEVGEKKDSRILVGFALETDNLIENAKEKLKSKHLDIIVANSAEAIEASTSSVTIIDCYNDLQTLDNIGKDKSAKIILDKVVELKKK